MCIYDTISGSKHHKQATYSSMSRQAGCLGHSWSCGSFTEVLSYSDWSLTPCVFHSWQHWILAWYRKCTICTLASVGRLLETAPNPPPGIRAVLRVDNHSKQSNTWCCYITTSFIFLISQKICLENHWFFEGFKICGTGPVLWF